MLKGHSKSVDEIVFSPNSEILVSVSKGENSVKFWDMSYIQEYGDDCEPYQEEIGNDDAIRINFNDDTCTILTAGIRQGYKPYKREEPTKFVELEDRISPVSEVSIKVWEFFPDLLELRQLRGYELSSESLVDPFDLDGSSIPNWPLPEVPEIPWEQAWEQGINDLLSWSCERLHGYLKNNPNVNKEDRTLCDDVLQENGTN